MNIYDLSIGAIIYSLVVIPLTFIDGFNGFMTANAIVGMTAVLSIVILYLIKKSGGEQ